MMITPVHAGAVHAPVLKDVTAQYEEVKKQFESEQCWGLSISLDLPGCHPDLIRSAEHIKKYVVELCDILDVTRFGDTQVVYFGREKKVEGYSMIQLIETSLISGHFANETDAAYIDIFSCKIYNPYEAAEFTKQSFMSSDVKMTLCYRK